MSNLFFLVLLGRTTRFYPVRKSVLDALLTGKSIEIAGGRGRDQFASRSPCQLRLINVLAVPGNLSILESDTGNLPLLLLVSPSREHFGSSSYSA